MNSTALDAFEDILQGGLVKICTASGLLAGEALSSEDIDGKWDEYVKDYVADAVENFNSYPHAALSFAAFLGMGVAAAWDRDWEKGAKAPYSSYYGSRGWDDMDEHILHDIFYLNLEKDEAKKIQGAMMNCAEACLGLIRHEGFEAQTADGFYILVRAYGVFYRIGAAIALKRMGYRKQAMPLNPQTPLQ